MSRLVWDQTGEHLYEIGVRNGVLYVMSTEGSTSGTYPNGVVWNGLTAVTEKPTGADATALYADDIKYLNLVAAEEFEATIEAYTYPDDFALCDGSAELATGIMVGQQPRKTFGFAYRTVIGNDVANDSYGYKLHLIYGALAAPSERAYSTINDSPEAITFSWDVKTTPVPVTGHKPTASLTIDSTKLGTAKMAALEAVLFGTDAEEFDASETYAVGDVVTKTESDDVTYYVCKTAITEAAAWDATKWNELEAEVGPRLPFPDEVLDICS